MKIKEVRIVETDPPEKKPKVKKPKPTRYCIKCGGIVDPKYKKCSQCGKQYFKWTWKKSVLLITNILILAIFCTSFYALYDEYQWQEWLYEKELKEYQDESIFWKTKYLKAGTTTASYHFLTVDDLISAVSNDVSKYKNIRVAVIGTYANFADTPYLFDQNNNSFSYSISNLYDISKGVYPSVILSFVNSANLTLTNGDYIKISGTIKIIDGDISLASCTYEVIAKHR